MQGGRLEPASVRISSDTAKVTGEAIRRLPLGTLFVEMLQNAERLFAAIAEAKVVGPEKGSWDAAPDAEWRQQYRAAVEQFGPQRGKRLNRTQLEIVADAYRAAYEAHRPVTAAVAAATNCSKSTAGKRIMAARRAGLLDDIGPETNEKEARR
jgi:hypothetical protein